jgi:hypothetical protein
MPGADESYGYSEVNKCAQSHLKPAHTLVVKTWNELVAICHVP